MKKYELVYIIHPDLEGNTAKITEKVKDKVASLGGKVLNEENWGKKKLAYEINKNSFGIYEFLLVEVEPASVKELERTLRLSEEIIRAMVVQAEKEVEGKKRDMTKAVKKTEAVKKQKKEKAETKKAEPKVEVKEPKKTKAEKEKEAKERQKELDEKLQEIIGPDKES